MPEEITTIQRNLKKSESGSELSVYEHENTIYMRKSSECDISSEFEITSQLLHPNIIKVYLQESKNSYLMEFCSGGDLFTKRPIGSNEELVSTFRQMCEAVNFLHKNKVSHLDIKLQNFVKDSKGNIKLIDFGHATQHPEKVTSIKGTNCYNAPERFEGEYNGLKADVFSLGVCLVGLMTGFIPAIKSGKSFALNPSFQSRPDLFWSMLERQCLIKVEDFSELNENGINLAEKLLKTDPSARPDVETILKDDFFCI